MAKNKVLSKVLTLCSLFVFTIPLTSCMPDESRYGKDAKDPTKSYISVFTKDKNHKDGFHLAVHPNTDEYWKYKSEDIYLNYNGKGNPDKIGWELTQWWSPKSIGLQTATYSFNEDEYSHTYTAPARQVVCKPDSNEVYFNTDTSIEYNMLYGEPELPQKQASSNQWSHSLLQANFDEPIRLEGYSSLVLDFDFTLNKCIYKGKTDADRSTYKGASQIFIYFTLYEYTSGWKNVMWFGVPIFDSRYNKINEYFQPDIWSGLPIYSLPSDLYFPVNDFYGLTKGRKYHVSIDMMPYFKKIYYGDGTNTPVYPDAKKENVYCCYINYGFEMPGAFEMAATIQNLDVYYAV